MIILLCISLLLGCSSTQKTQEAQEEVHEQVILPPELEEDPKPMILKDEPATPIEKVINTYGNTARNIQNLGYAAMQGDWIYYLREQSDKLQNEGELYRINVINGKKEKISDQPVMSINVVGDWVYYCSQEASGDNKMWNYPIYRTKVDGTMREKLGTIESSLFFVIVDMIYYMDASDRKIYSMRIDGTQVTRLTDEETLEMSVAGQWIYYVADGDIYKIKLDGSEKGLVHSGEVVDLLVEGNSIYYKEGYEGPLLRMNVDGTGKIEFSNDIITSFNIHGDYMYYNIMEGEFKEASLSKDELNKRSEYIKTIYRVDLDGNNKTTIAEGGVGNIAGEWNYFYADYFDENVLELERIKLDGTGREKVM